MNRFIAIIVLSTIVFFLASCDTSEKDFEKACEIHTIENYEFFLEKHLKSELANAAKDSIVAIATREWDMSDIYSYRYKCQYTDVNTRLREFLERRVEEEYEKAYTTNTIESWTLFLNNVPSAYSKDARDRINTLEKQAEAARWSTETKAWETATERDNQASYEKYKELYPNGRHANQAEKKLIDIDVASVFAGEHGMLPKMDRGYSTGTAYSIIEIENRTQYELTVSYSGPDSKRLVIPSYMTKSMRLKNGSYRVAARVGHNVRPYAGNEYLDGSEYSSSFYIETRRF